MAKLQWNKLYSLSLEKSEATDNMSTGKID